MFDLRVVMLGGSLTGKGMYAEICMSEVTLLLATSQHMISAISFSSASDSDHSTLSLNHLDNTTASAFRPSISV